MYDFLLDYIWLVFIFVIIIIIFLNYVLISKRTKNNKPKKTYNILESINSNSTETNSSKNITATDELEKTRLLDVNEIKQVNNLEKELSKDIEELPKLKERP